LGNLSEKTASNAFLAGATAVSIAAKHKTLGGAMPISLTINGKAHTLDVAPDTPLLWVLRDELGLTGAKFGCGVAACGACTVHLNGTPVRSCSIPIQQLADADVVTIEGLNDRIAKAVQAAWQEKDVVQCGYCQSGQIMSAISLLQQNPKPSEQDINDAMSGNACRCATYVRIKDAIQLASQQLEA
jgi:isoquinoline 1-oxidoreductase alpha subunit